MDSNHRRPLGTAVRTIVHTILTVLAMVVGGAFDTFEVLDATVRASEGIARGCSEVIDARRKLRVRLVPAKNVDTEMIETVQKEVVELWRDYGVDVIWEDKVWEDGANLEDKPELFVHFVDRELMEGKKRRRGPSAVAWIRFYDGVPGNVVNLSMAAADRLLNDSPWLDSRPMRHAPIDLQQRLIATMVGRALAHEIGHYLLASSTHVEHGLMKALITPDEFVKLGRRHLQLMPENVRTLRAVRLAACQLSASTGAAVTQ
jgi:hypothetical protein